VNLLKEFHMLFSRAIVAALTVVLLGAVSEAGQGRAHKWWQSELVKAELGLTREQSLEVEQIFQASVPKLKASKQELDRLEAELSRLIAEGVTDEHQVTLKIERVEAARGELGKLRTLMLYRVHRLLTPAQRAKLKAINDRGERERDRIESSRR
jgi:Spy/CpxP family protein refolding chaperone